MEEMRRSFLPRRPAQAGQIHITGPASGIPMRMTWMEEEERQKKAAAATAAAATAGMFLLSNTHPYFPKWVRRPMPALAPST